MPEDWSASLLLRQGRFCSCGSLRRYVRRMATFIKVMMAVKHSCEAMPICNTVSLILKTVERATHLGCSHLAIQLYGMYVPYILLAIIHIRLACGLTKMVTHLILW